MNDRVASIIGESHGATRARARWALAWMLSLGAVGSGLSLPSAAAERSPATIVEVRVNDGRLTVDAVNAPLGRVLRTIGEQAGFVVTFRDDLLDPVTESFAGLPLEEGLRRLTLGYSVAITYAAPAPGSPAGAVPAEVRIIGRSSSPDAPARVGRARSLTSVPGRRDAEVPGPPPASSARVSGEPARSTGDVPVNDRIREIRSLTRLASQGSESAVVQLTALSASEPSAEVRQHAVDTLARLDGPHVEPALTAALSDEDAAVRARAVRGLRRAGTESALQSLAAAAASDTDSAVRLAALRALASYRGPAVRQALVAASADPDETVRDTAARTLLWWNTSFPGTR